MLIGSICHFSCPRIDRSGAYSFWPVCLSVRPFVRLFLRKNFCMGRLFLLVSVRAFVFHMSIPCDKTFLLVPSSKSSFKVKVEYQGHDLEKKNGHCGGIRFHKHKCCSTMFFTSSIKDEFYRLRNT